MDIVRTSFNIHDPVGQGLQIGVEFGEPLFSADINPANLDFMLEEARGAILEESIHESPDGALVLAALSTAPRGHPHEQQVLLLQQSTVSEWRSTCRNCLS